MATRKAMVEAKRRVVLDEVEDDGFIAPSYFSSGSAKENINWVSTGCCVFDEALGGGYALGRVVNIVGDKSSGKTLLAMEACAQIARLYDDAWIRYAETEAAFDPEYAEALGIPVGRITMNEKGATINTVEDLYEDMVKCLDKFKGRPGLYIVDSLDAISDEAEQGRKFDEGTYGGTKPKQIGKMFRMLVDRFNEQQVLLVIISQLRDKIGTAAMFGDTKTRSGGRALDFYATHIVWLQELGKKKRTVGGVERIVGVDVRARVKKNKIGLAHREASYPVLYGYGIDDMTAAVEWLIDNKAEDRLKDLDVSKSGYKVKIQAMRDKGGQPVRDFRATMVRVVREEWRRIEESFLPKARKY